MVNWKERAKRLKRDYFQEIKEHCSGLVENERGLSEEQKDQMLTGCYVEGVWNIIKREEACSLEVSKKLIRKKHKLEKCMTKGLAEEKEDLEFSVMNEAERLRMKNHVKESDEQQTDDFAKLRTFLISLEPWRKGEFKNNFENPSIHQDVPLKKGKTDLNFKNLVEISDMSDKDQENNIFHSNSNFNGSQHKRLTCEFEQTYYSSEEEIRCEMFNTILENVRGVQLFDSGIDRSNEYVYMGRFPFVPMTGDILYKIKNRFKSIELKFTKMYPQRDSKVKGKYYRVCRPLKIQPIQLELIEKGLMTLILISELVENPERFGIAMAYGESAKLRDGCLKDIQTLRDAYGRNELAYKYLIINQENFRDYREYFDSLALFEKRERGKVIGYRKTLRFPKLYRRLTPSNRRFQALRSNLCLDIVVKIFLKI